MAVVFGPNGPKIAVDSSGGHPNPNHFIDRPLGQLAPAGAVHIKVPQSGPDSLVSGTNADIVFYLRLKATHGCTGKLDPSGAIMHLYIEPDSPAARLFVSRMMAKHRALPGGHEIPRELAEQRTKLLPGG